MESTNYDKINISKVEERPFSLSSPLDSALFYNDDKYGLNASVIPILNPDQNPNPEDIDKAVEVRKHPAFGTGELKPYLYGEKRFTADELKAHYEQNPNHNLGIILGINPSRLIAVDVDGSEADAYMGLKKNKEFSDSLKRLFDTTMIVQTGRGKHFLFRLTTTTTITDDDNNKGLIKVVHPQIWVKPNSNPDEKHDEIRIIDGGHYLMGFGSRHPNGNYYRRLNDNNLPQSITPELLDEFVTKISNRKIQAWEKKTITSTSASATSLRTKTKAINQSVLDNISIAEARLIKAIGELYNEGGRQEWWVAASGLIRRHGIPLNDAINICRKICRQMSDEESEKRIKVMIRTYTEKEAVEVAGWGFLEDFVKIRNLKLKDEELKDKIKWVKFEILAALFELKLDVIKRDNAWKLIESGNSENYVVVRKSDNDTELVEGDRLVKIRRVQLLEVKRKRIEISGNVDNVGRGDILSLDFTEVLLDAVPANESKIEIVKDPLFGGIKYRMGWEYVDRRTGEIKTIPESPTLVAKNKPMSKKELEKWLKEETTWVCKPLRLSEALDSVINAYENKPGWTEYKTEIDPTGFFWLDGRVVVSKIDIKSSLSTDEVKRAANAIIELQEKFFNGGNGRDKLRFTHYLKFHIVGGFDYVRKQRGLIPNHGFIPRSDLCGYPGTGKSELGKLGCYLRGLNEDDYVIGKRSVRTEPRLIEELGKTTLPITLEEMDFLGKTDKPGVEDVISTLKDSVTKKGGSRLTKDHEEIEEPYLAPVILTHNSSPVMEGGMSRRFIIDIFRDVDVKENKDNYVLMQKVRDYNKYIDENSEDIRNICHFTDQYIIENPDLLMDHWEKTASDLLHALFLSGGVDYPEWLDVSLQDAEMIKSGVSGAYLASDYGEHFKDQNLGAIKSYVNDEFARHARIYETTMGERPSDVRFDDRIKWLGLTNRLSGMIYSQEENTIYFTGAIRGILKKYGVEVDKAYQNIENFASICGFQPERKSIEKDGPVKRAASVDMEKLIRMLSPGTFDDMLAVQNKVA